MNEDTKNKQCQICKGYLFEEDDVVVCPICGAPHHRDCYNSIGHCGVEKNHGTDLQYDKVQKKAPEQHAEAKTCSRCHRTSNALDADFCPYCGQSFNTNKTAEPHIIIGGINTAFDPLGGVDKNTSIDGVKAEDVATFVGGTSRRYIPRFVAMNKGRMRSWNWAAFLFPSVWSFSKKMYLNGFMYLFLSLASKLCFVPFEQTLVSLGDASKITETSQYYSFIMENLDQFGTLTMIMCILGVALSIVPRIISGLYSDWHYRGHVIKKIKTIKSQDDIEDEEFELKKAGATNLLLMLLAFGAEFYLPRIITMFLW